MPMRFRSYLMGSVHLLLIALLVGQTQFANPRPQQEYTDRLGSRFFLRYGETLALADCDGDHRIDRAILDGTGCSKSIKVDLSRTKTAALLRFNTKTRDLGSLFATDLDGDGDDDLIWTDLVHPENAVIWLADGNGQFEPTECYDYAEQFVLNSLPAVGGTERDYQDLATASQRDPLPTPALSRRFASLSETKPLNLQPTQVWISNCAVLLPSDRSPPPLS